MLWCRDNVLDGVGTLARHSSFPEKWLAEKRKIHPDHRMSVTGGENPMWEPALLPPRGLHPIGAQHPLPAGLEVSAASARSRQSWACLSCSFQGCSAIPNCHKNKCFLLHITEQRNFPQVFFFFLLSLLFFFFFSEASLKVVPSPSLRCLLPM